jgi:hypothetical protein
VTPPKEVLVSERIWRLWRLRFWYRTAAVVDLPVGDRNDLRLRRSWLRFLREQKTTHPHPCRMRSIRWIAASGSSQPHLLSKRRSGVPPPIESFCAETLDFTRCNFPSQPCPQQGTLPKGTLSVPSGTYFFTQTNESSIPRSSPNSGSSNERSARPKTNRIASLVTEEGNAASTLACQKRIDDPVLQGTGFSVKAAGSPTERNHSPLAKTSGSGVK